MTDDQKYFNSLDYTIFCLMMLVPLLIGLYYLLIARKRSPTVSEYLVGNRNMSIFPVSMSLAARYMHKPPYQHHKIDEIIILQHHHLNIFDSSRIGNIFLRNSIFLNGNPENSCIILRCQCLYPSFSQSQININ